MRTRRLQVWLRHRHLAFRDLRFTHVPCVADPQLLDEHRYLLRVAQRQPLERDNGVPLYRHQGVCLRLYEEFERLGGLVRK